MIAAFSRQPELKLLHYDGDRDLPGWEPPEHLPVLRGEPTRHKKLRRTSSVRRLTSNCGGGAID